MWQTYYQNVLILQRRISTALFSIVVCNYMWLIKYFAFSFGVWPTWIFLWVSSILEISERTTKCWLLFGFCHKIMKSPGFTILHFDDFFSTTIQVFTQWFGYEKENFTFGNIQRLCNWEPEKENHVLNFSVSVSSLQNKFSTSTWLKRWTVLKPPKTFFRSNKCFCEINLLYFLALFRTTWQNNCQINLSISKLLKLSWKNNTVVFFVFWDFSSYSEPPSFEPRQPPSDDSGSEPSEPAELEATEHVELESPEQVEQLKPLGFVKLDLLPAEIEVEETVECRLLETLENLIEYVGLVDIIL